MKNFTLFLTTFLMTLISIHAWSLEIPPKALKRASLEEQPNLVINGNFSDGLNSWTSFIADFAGVAASVAVTNGEAAITNITGAGGEVWFVQLNQLFTPAQIGALEVGQTYKASFQARSSAANRQLRMFFGQDGDGFQPVNITDFTLSAEMQTFEATFVLDATFGAMKLGFEMGLSNDPVFIDNVSLAKTEASEEPTDPGTGLSLPVTFELETDYALTDFGGNASEIVVDPTNPANKVAQSIKTVDAELWAGTTVGGDTGFASPIPFAPGATTMSVRVWSPVAGIPVRLKVEDSRDNTISVETEATVTRASEWQTLTFNFANQATGTEAINFARSYNKASIFFDFGRTGAEAGGARTYFWDDMAFGEGQEQEEPETPVTGVGFPFTFEEDIDWASIITGFEGGVLDVIDNPDSNGNSSARVARMVKNQGEVFAGAFIDLDAPIDLGAGTDFPVQVWAPRANSTMLLKFENSANSAEAFEQILTIPTANQWTEITFNMVGANRTFRFDRVIFIFDQGTVGDGSANFTWFFDNLRQEAGDGGIDPNKPTIPITFEEDLNWEEVIAGFEGGVLDVIDNPDSNGNASARVGRMVKNPGAVFAGAFMDLGAPIDLAEGTEFRVQVWAPRTNTTMLLKFENSGNGAENFEQSVTIGTANEWTEIAFNMSGANRTHRFDRVVIIFDNGTAGDGTAAFTWFIDNIRQVESGPAVATVDLPVTFENENLDYGLIDFGGTFSEIIIDPTNTSNRVVRTIKPLGAETWAGVTVGGNTGFVSAIPFTSDATTMSVRVWSTLAGAPVRLKVEDSTNPNISVETEAIVTRAQVWETLTFDFSNQATGTEAINFNNTYNKASIFFNFGVTGDQAGEHAFFWDDMVFGEGEETGGSDNRPVLPITFEEDIDWAAVITNFDGGDLTVIDNPDPTGNSSARVGRMVKNAGQPWAGSFITLGEPVNLTNGTEFTAQVWAPRANTRMLLKFENEINENLFVQEEIIIAEANQWVNVTFDMSDGNPANLYRKMVIIFDLGDVGDGSANFTWFVDNFAQGGDAPEPEEPTNLIINGSFADGLNSWTPFIADFAGVNANVAVTNGEAAITGITGAGGEVWHVQLNQIFTPAQIALLEIGETYTASFQARSTVEGRQLRMYFGEDGGGFQSINVTDVTLGTEMQTFEVTFELGATYGAMKLGFEMGLSNDPVFIDNVTLVKGEGETSEPEVPTSLVINGDFADGLNSWTPFIADFAGVSANVAVTNGEAAITNITGAGGEIWHVQLNQIFTPAQIALLELGESYKVSFQARSTVEGRQLRMYFGEDGGGFRSIDVTDVTLGTEMQTFEVSFEVGATYDAMKLGFEMGLSNDPVFIDNVSMVKEVFELRGQTITFVDIPAQLAGGDPIELEATASSGLAVTFTAESENISIEGNVVTLLAAGRATIVATQEGNNEFRPAPPVTRTFCINPLRPTITLSGEGTGNTVLTSSASVGNQWFRNGIAIEGATGQTFTVTNQGSYTVAIRVDDCVSEASEAINLIVNSNRIQLPRELTVFPNPVETFLQIRGVSETVTSVEMVDMTGRISKIVFEQSNEGIRANVANLAPGMYVVRIQEGNRSYAVKVLKK